ncbi:MAG TPA: ester cyclase [Solirubrobacteraceae bacterium]|nr:ester cyclase [Solirubrobacteraceae bacterium]
MTGSRHERVDGEGSAATRLPTDGGGSAAPRSPAAPADPSPTADATPGGLRFTPAPDLSISVRARRARGELEPDPTRPRAQPMRGYEDTYVDIVDYIIRITDRIWEDQDVGYIYDTYSPGCRVYNHHMQYGVESVLQHTLEALSAFPDARHIADDVIWAGNEDEGFATSHRAVNVGRHLGAWEWGPATGAKIQTWVIANCVSQENVIFEEWIQDNACQRLMQCGVDLRAAARRFGNAGRMDSIGERELAEVDRLRAGRPPRRAAEPPRGTSDLDALLRAYYHNLYNLRDLSAVDRLYSAGTRWHGPSDREGHGRQAPKAMARNLLATFPDLGVAVDEVYWMGSAGEGYAASVRWTGAGTHLGHSLYGEPTGRRVHLWGISQLYLRDGEVVEEYGLFNEFDVLAQLLRDEPAALEASRP